MVLSVVTSVLLVAGARPSLAVLDVQPLGAPPESATALSEAVTQELTRRGFFEVVSSRDIQTLLGLERQRQLLGCADEAASCIAEVAGALGSRFVLSSTLTRLGDALQLSVQMLDTQKGQPVARGVRLARDVDGLVAQLPVLLAEATGTPLPPPPPRALPLTLIVVGGAALIAGGIVGIDAMSRDRALIADLTQPAGTGIFKGLPAYRRRLPPARSRRW